MKLFAIILMAALSSPIAHASEAETFVQDLGISSAELTPEVMESLNEQIIQLSQQPLDLSASEPVQETQLKLVGRGIMDRTTGQSLALACVGEKPESPTEKSCSTLRYVLFNGAESRFIGEAIQITSKATPSDAELNTELKAINKDFRKYRRKANFDRNLLIIGAAVVPGAGLLIAAPQGLLAAAILGVPAVAVVGFATVGGTAIATLILSETSLFTSSTINQKVFLDQNGWNWSVQPKKVSHRNFDLYVKFSSR